MEFFDKIGKKASEAYKYTADKTGKLAKETKLKIKMGELKSEINDLYEEIGKNVYEKHVRKETIEIKGELEELCTKIDVASDEIESLLKICIELRDKKQCPECHTQIEKEDKYCKECGAKQEEIETIVVDFENDQQNEDSAKSNNEKNDKNSEKSKEEKNDENSEKSNLEKTTEIEIDSKLKDNESEAEIVENLIESE